MSSLIDALGPPIDPALIFDFSVHPADDVDMLPPPSHTATALSEQPEEMADLFGDEDAEIVKHDSVPSPPAAEQLQDVRTPSELHRQALEYQEEDEPEAHILVVREADLAVPNLPAPRSSDGKYWTIRIPHYCKMDSRPFHPDTYMGPEHEEDESQQAETLREKSMSIKLEVESTVRWRWIQDDNGQHRRQSNSRIVRWSDGSLSLLLGKELFDITQTIDNSASSSRQLLGSQPPQTPAASTATGAKSQGLMYLVAQHKRAQILQSEVLVTGTMTLRPTGMQSETHRMLVRAVGQKHNKVARLRMAPDPTKDPEREKMEMIKNAAKKPKRAKRDPDDAGVGGTPRRRRGATRRRTSDPVWSDEEDAEFGGSEEDDYDGMDTSRKNSKRTRDDNKKKGGEYQTDDFVVSDPSDEDGGDASDDGGSRKRKKPRKGDEEEPEEDDLDKLESKLERQREDRRKNRSSVTPAGGPEVTDKDAEDQEEMDVESEEEDEAFKVRKAGSGTRRKRALEVEDEDEE